MLSEPYLLAPLFDFLFHDKIGLDSLPAGLCFDSTPLVSNNKIKWQNQRELDEWIKMKEIT